MVGPPGAILLNVSTAIVGTIILTSGTIGQLVTKCNILERLILFASGIFLLIPGWQLDLIAIGLVFVILQKQLRQRKSEAKSIQF